MTKIIIAAFGLLLIFEGLLYAIFPNTMKKMIKKMLETSDETLKWAGITSALFGLILIWFIKG